MSNIVEGINDDLKTVVTNSVGAGWSELDHVYDLEKNSFRTNFQRYGVIPDSAVQSLSISKYYTMEQNFIVILTDRYMDRSRNDTDKKATVFTLFNKMDEIFKEAYLTRINNANVVNIKELAMDTPEFLEEEKMVVLRATFTIIYRNQVNN